MTALRVVVLALLAIAIGLSGLRWLRVAQREHYLGGAASRFAWRWWTSRRIDESCYLVACAAAAGCVGSTGAGIVVALIIGMLPRGLGVRGRSSKLRWTRRLVTVATLSATLVIAAVVIGTVGGGLQAGVVVAAIVVVVCPLIVDVALFILRPFESALGSRYVRRAKARLARVNPMVVAITGSFGKTSTKRYVAHLLEGRFQVLASPHSYNNQAGLSRSVNELLTPGTDVFVAEMGTYGVGEIAALCRWLPPKISIITAIGPVHLERFRSLERTLSAKAEITNGAEVVVLNIDDDRLAKLSGELEQRGQQVFTCSAIDVSATVAVVPVDGGFELFVRGLSIGRASIDPVGIAATNVACAVAGALALGCSEEEIVERVSGLPAVAHRLEAMIGANGATVLDDTYNSNPAGARLALSRLAAAIPGGRRVVVTPGMVELGPVQSEENAAFAHEAGTIASDFVIVGRTNRRALRAGLGIDARTGDGQASPIGEEGVTVHESPNRDAAVALVASRFGPGDTVLFENDLPDHYP